MTHPQPLPAAATAALPSETQTVVLAQRGETSALDELARSCRQQAYLFALQLTGHPDDALDVAQDAMLRFFRSLGRFDPERPVRPWLLHIVRNLVRDRARRRRVRRTESLEPDEGVLRLEPSDPGPDPEALASRRQLQALAWRCLQALPSEYREVLVLRDYQGLAYAEIAAALEIPRGTVMSRLHRARRRLQELVRQRQRRTGEV
ncbi:MAG: sigma-70 family RNA polymerase sigma factor [Thermoanaerobaculales bacterium]|jgi:RNA polymerase sigma-70 factor (ECF subfamily)|nr:sigma-70 family RNA polymerase sigma factor [Thermoanaerobaculales bacterium]